MAGGELDADGDVGAGSVRPHDDSLSVLAAVFVGPGLRRVPRVAALATLAAVPLLAREAAAVQLVVVVVRRRLEAVSERRRATRWLNQPSVTAALVDRMHQNAHNHHEI